MGETQALWRFPGPWCTPGRVPVVQPGNLANSVALEPGAGVEGAGGHGGLWPGRHNEATRLAPGRRISAKAGCLARCLLPGRSGQFVASLGPVLGQNKSA
jgi:hypothetical protein